VSSSIIPKDIKPLIKEACRNGWKLTGGGSRHFKLSKGADMVVISCTPGDHRSLLATRSLLRRFGAVR